MPTPNPRSGHQRRRKPSRFTLLLTLLGWALCLGFGCNPGEPPTPAKAEQTGQQVLSPTKMADARGSSDGSTTVPVAEKLPPRRVGQWPPGYDALLLDAPFVTMLIDPNLLKELSEPFVDLAVADVEMSMRAMMLLESGIGDLAKLSDPTKWAEHGFDASRLMMVQLASVGPDGLFAELSEVYQTHATPKVTDLPEVGLLETACVAVRLTIPVSDPVLAKEFLDSALLSLSAIEAEPVEGYTQVLVVDGSFFVGLVVEDSFVTLDVLLYPWTYGRAPNAAQARAALHALRTEKGPSPPLVGPVSKEVRAFVGVALNRLNPINQAAILYQGKVSHALDDQLASAMLSQRFLGAESPYRAITLELGPDNAMSFNALFAHAQPKLESRLGSHVSLAIDSSLDEATFLPLIASESDVWQEAGLTFRGLGIQDLVHALSGGDGVLPLLFPLWSSVAPALVWRDLVPSPARYFKPESVESTQLVWSADETHGLSMAVALVDAGGDLATHRHGFACIMQRRPVQGACRDEKIVLGQLGQTHLARQDLYYWLEKREETVVLIVSTDQELAGSLSRAPLVETKNLVSLRASFDAADIKAIEALLGGSFGFMGSIAQSVEATVTVDQDGLWGTARFTPSITWPTLVRAAGPAFVEYVRRTKEVEAMVNLEAMGNAIENYHAVHHALPISAEMLCSEGAEPMGKRVPSEAANWERSIWRDLGFSVPHSHVFRYCYQSDSAGNAFAAVAEASLEGTTVDSRYCLTGRVDSSGQLTNSLLELVDAMAPCHLPTP